MNLTVIFTPSALTSMSVTSQSTRSNQHSVLTNMSVTCTMSTLSVSCTINQHGLVSDLHTISHHKYVSNQSIHTGTRILCLDKHVCNLRHAYPCQKASLSVNMNLSVIFTPLALTSMSVTRQSMQSNQHSLSRQTCL